MSDMETLQADLLAQVESAADLAQLDAVRVAVLGKKGLITEKMKTLGAMSPDERKAAGQQFNTLKTAVPRKRHGGFLKKADYLANTFLSLAKRGRPSTFSSFVSP